jgi:hypothetical protein
MVEVYIGPGPCVLLHKAASEAHSATRVHEVADVCVRGVDDQKVELNRSGVQYRARPASG